METSPTRVVVVMGVAGAGKTTVGQMLAGRLGWACADADDFHSQANIDKMRSGVALADADRAAWLDAIARRIEEWLRTGQPGVIACSALKRRYRDVLAGGRPGVRFVYLKLDERVLTRRLAERRDHFMAPSLLSTQLEALEEPSEAEHAITVSAADPAPQIVENVLCQLR